MDNGSNYGYCTVCGGTMSVHINVSKPLDHKFSNGACNHEYGPDSTVKDHLVEMTGRWIRACMVCSVGFAKG